MRVRCPKCHEVQDIETKMQNKATCRKCHTVLHLVGRVDANQFRDQTERFVSSPFPIFPSVVNYTNDSTPSSSDSGVTGGGGEFGGGGASGSWGDSGSCDGGGGCDGGSCGCD